MRSSVRVSRASSAATACIWPEVCTDHYTDYSVQALDILFHNSCS